ncbi:hypothetical protein [Brachybacterium vulturis]|uniref:hypothetical protein n=1 Tax=Brachybacterium vulturis TaxID=2017484 RepID=UPI00373512D8
MAFLGADTGQLRDQGTTTRDGARRLEELCEALDGAVRAIEWTGPDADDFRRLWEGQVRSRGRGACEQLDQRAVRLEEEADEQDTCSDDGSGESGSGGWAEPGGSPWDSFQDWLEHYEAKESDGFFGDLLGGPEAGYWGNLGWSGASITGDIAGLVPEPTGVAAGIGLYDAAQSFQDGDPFGAFDGLVTAGINILDIPAGALSVVPYPPAKLVGEGVGIATGSLDMAWSAITAQAQISAIAGGPGDGSASRFMMEMPGWGLEQMTGNTVLSDATRSGAGGVEEGFGWGSETIRDAVPTIDPILDLPQHVVENVIPSGGQDWIEGTATDANEWIRDRMPW